VGKNVHPRGIHTTELDLALKGFKIEPQSKDQALANVRKMRSDLGIENMQVDKNQMNEILKRAGSLTDEVLSSREKERM
jgi:hypothetical protein